MNERKYFAVSLKHLYPWKFGDRLCLWGYKRTKDNEERCFGGYTECVENAELYSIEEFCGAYNKMNEILDRLNKRKDSGDVVVFLGLVIMYILGCITGGML